MKNKSFLQRRGEYILSALVALLIVFWLMQFNLYHVIYYREQMQLFRFDWFYFRTYLIKPGGITEYAGAFLTQFCFYPLFGAVIISLLLAGIYLLLASICRRSGKIEYFFPALYIPVFLLMIAITNQYFRLSYLVGLIVYLSGFRIYIAIKRPARYITGFVLLLIVYFIAAGNAFLFLLSVLIFELFNSVIARRNDEAIHLKFQNHYLYLPALAIFAIVIPFSAYRFIYTVTPREAYFALTPFDFLYPGFVIISAWLSIPVIYALRIALTNRLANLRPALWKTVVSGVLVIGMCIGSMAFANDRRAETLTGMAFGVQNNNWERTVNLGVSYPFSNNLTSYFTNIALAQSGQLPYRMFYYDQTGPSGLFLKRQESYFTILYIGEAYYRLGLIREAEHSSFEAMVGNTVEHNSQTLRRLVTTSIIDRDTALFNKYIRLFDHTLFYRSWAERQRKYMASALADSLYVLPETPPAASTDDFFLGYAKPDIILNKLLEKNPDHRLAFEYLMAWYMLNKDMNNVKRCMDDYFQRFPYHGIPTHYEEALLVYQNMNPTENITAQYPISQQTISRFNDYVQAYKQVRSTPDKQMMKNLHQQFGNTYWFYFHFRQPDSLQKTEDETNRY